MSILFTVFCKIKWIANPALTYQHLLLLCERQDASWHSLVIYSIFSALRLSPIALVGNFEQLRTGIWKKKINNKRTVKESKLFKIKGKVCGMLKILQNISSEELQQHHSIYVSHESPKKKVSNRLLFIFYELLELFMFEHNFAESYS